MKNKEEVNNKATNRRTKRSIWLAMLFVISVASTAMVLSPIPSSKERRSSPGGIEKQGTPNQGFAVTGEPDVSGPSP